MTAIHSDTIGVDPAAIGPMFADKDVVVFEAAERSLLAGINPLLDRKTIDTIGDELSQRPGDPRPSLWTTPARRGGPPCSSLLATTDETASHKGPVAQPGAANAPITDLNCPQVSELSTGATEPAGTVGPHG